MNNLTPFSGDTTPLKSSTELQDSKPSKTSLTGSEPGPLKAKVWLTDKNPCKQPVQTLATQRLLTQGHRSYLSLQMCSTRLEKSGPKPCQSSIAKLIKLSVIFKSLAKTLLLKWSQSDSKWVITSLKLTQNSTFTRVMKVNAISLFISADSQERTRTYSW